MSAGIRLIVGLANPGKQYADTRHNVGAWFLHQLSAQYHFSFSLNSKFYGFSGHFLSQSNQCYALEPTTFMNNSGRAVRSLAQFYKLSPEQILVVHDELDFEPGIIRFKTGGGHGGHNGLRDIMAELGTPEFHRLRVGIGHPGNRDLVTSYVLGEPSKSDKEKILESIDNGLRVVDDLVNAEFEKAMRYLHG